MVCYIHGTEEIVSTVRAKSPPPLLPSLQAYLVMHVAHQICGRPSFAQWLLPPPGGPAKPLAGTLPLSQLGPAALGLPPLSPPPPPPKLKPAFKKPGPGASDAASLATSPTRPSDVAVTFLQHAREGLPGEEGGLPEEGALLPEDRSSAQLGLSQRSSQDADATKVRSHQRVHTFLCWFLTSGHPMVNSLTLKNLACHVLGEGNLLPLPKSFLALGRLLQTRGRRPTPIGCSVTWSGCRRRSTPGGSQASSSRTSAAQPPRTPPPTRSSPCPTTPTCRRRSRSWPSLPPPCSRPGALSWKWTRTEVRLDRRCFASGDGV